VRPRWFVLFDVAAWAMMLGAAAFLGVMLDRIAVELSPRLTAGVCAAGALGCFLRWALVRRPHAVRSVSYDTERTPTDDPRRPDP
jgi:hypothetical protein